MTDLVSDDIEATVEDGDDAVILAKSSAEFDYSAELPDAAARTNTATATWDADAAHTPSDSASTGPVDVTFDPDNPTTTSGEDCVTVTDSELGPIEGTYCDDATIPYSITWEDIPAGTCTDYQNIATIVETEQNDDAWVEVCRGADLTVSKTAATSYNRDWSWTIDKSVVGEASQNVSGNEATFDYLVTLDKTTTDSAWAVSGTITVTNPNDWDVTVDVTDLVSDDIEATVVGGADAVIPAGGSVDFDYNADLPNANARTNTATATWDADAAHTPNGSASSDAVAVTFDPANPTSTSGEDCVTVTDSEYGPIEGTFCDDATIPYSITWDSHPRRHLHRVRQHRHHRRDRAE